jgi:crotonobetainyl-CoA:carnitine CoA-transferase CaiB-like acyl-CoA transferase
MAMPLEGLRVLDLTNGIAGAYCAKLLVDGGANAIKVEGPEGDPLRRWWASGLGDEPDGTGALFEWLNASKRSVVADLTTAEGLARVRHLVRQSDIVLESFPAGQIEAFGLGPAQIRAQRRQAVLVSISDLGRGVSHDDTVFSELLLQSLSGSVHGRGHSDRFPLVAGGRLGEWATGVYAAVGALVAWRRARACGVGEHVDVSRLESMAVTLVGYASLMRHIQGEGAKPYSRSVEIPSVEKASDGWIGFCTVTNAQWQAFAIMAEQYERAEGEWSLLSYRQAHRAEAEAMIDAFTSRHRVDELLEESAKFRVPAAPVTGGAKIPETEPFRSMGVYVRPPSGRFLAPRTPFRFSRNETRPLGASPAVGEHTELVTSALATDSGACSTESPFGGARPLPFGGIRVIDFSAFWAGPYAAALLGALGADVIKVESIGRPDPIRFSSSAPPSDPQWHEKSAIFGSCNANKRGVTLALDTPEGRDLALQLISGADIVIENFTPRVMEQFGLGYAQLAEIRPDIVMVRISAFGSTGPWRDRGGFAQTMEQITGMAWITGHAEGPPLIPRGACDPIGGMHAVVALLMALEHRDRTGEGQLVEVPLVETSANVAAEVVIEWSAYGRELVRDGNHGPEGSPQGVYRCQGTDSWVALSVLEDAHWHRLVAAIGSPSWVHGPAFATVAGRRQSADVIDRGLSAWSGSRSAKDAASTLRQHGVPSTVVTPADRIDEIPQLRGRDFWIPIDHPVAGCHEGPGWPIRFSGMRSSWPGGPAPTLGQHNQDVLVGDLGLTSSQLEYLAQRGIVGQTMSGR